MSDDLTNRPGAPKVTVYSYDCRSQLGGATPWAGDPPTAAELAALVLRQNPAFAFQHDVPNRVFRLTWADGRVEEVRDRPVRYLVLEPDARTGELKSVVRRGRPWYLYLCRAEHEGR